MAKSAICFDVDDDGKVVPLDALLVINKLNSGGANALTDLVANDPYYDVTGNDFLEPLDALLVINELNLSRSVLAVDLALLSDTGFSPTDKLTNDGRVQGELTTSASGPLTAKVRFNRQTVMDAVVGSDGKFVFPTQAISTLVDGAITAKVFMTDGFSNGLKQLSFILDKTPPPLEVPKYQAWAIRGRIKMTTSLNFVTQGFNRVLKRAQIFN